MLDARDAAAFERGHAPGAANLPAAEWDARAAELPPRGFEFSVVGDDGAQAEALALALVERGHAGARAADRELLAQRSETGPARAFLWRPTPWLEASLRALKARPARAGARPKALDLATGSGRDAVWLALHGHATWGLDLLPDALERARSLLAATARARAAAGAFALAPCGFVRADATLDPPFRDGTFDVVCVFRYLDRDRFGAIARLVAPRGTLVCETFTIEQARFGRPKRPEFLLLPGELERLCEAAGLEVVAAGESVSPGGPALASVRARRS